MIHIEREIFEKNDNLLKIDAWKDFGVDAGFTTKNGGVSEDTFTSFNQSFNVNDDAKKVLENRQKLATLVGIPYENWVFAQQLHTNTIKAVSKDDAGAGSTDFESGIPACDGLYTKEDNLALATFYADCTPVYFIAPKHHLIGIVHAGWQGTVKEITTAFIKEWKSLGVKPADIQVVIGPSASQAAYEVGTDVVELVLKMELESSRDALIMLDEETFKLDVAYLNYMQAIAQGIPEDNIIISSYCTISDEGLFYSFRRDGETGRMLAYISQK